VDDITFVLLLLVVVVVVVFVVLFLRAVEVCGLGFASLL
jgi:hypothetical protein